jgi:hypothetical protein
VSRGYSRSKSGIFVKRTTNKTIPIITIPLPLIVADPEIKKVGLPPKYPFGVSNLEFYNH